MGIIWFLEERKHIYWYPSNHVDGIGSYDLCFLIPVKFFKWKFRRWVCVCSLEDVYTNHEEAKKLLLKKYKNRKK